VYSILFYTDEDRLGDALIKLPAILGLKQSRPDIHLVWATGMAPSVFATVLAPLVSSCIDEVYQETQLGTRWRKRPHELHQRRFDCVIASGGSFRSAVALRRIPHETFIAPAANFLLSMRKPAVTFGPTVHRQTRLLLELAINRPIELIIDLPIPSHERTLAKALLPPGIPYVGFAPGAGGLDKCWPLPRYIETAGAQVAHGRTPVFFLGPNEAHWREQIRGAIPTALFPEYDHDARRGGPILTIALAAHLAVGVANDAGAGHLLAAGGRPLISLFGKTNPLKFEPPYNRRIVISATNYQSRDVTSIPVHPVLKAIDDVCANYHG
jgi:ADP-heptose:LPS heptosyltransferase